jgi:predicted nucleic acid-binding protein
MATISGERIFIDTNILVYANISGSPFHELARQCLEDLSQNQNSLWISRQVLREYLAIVTRPGTFPIVPTPLLLGERIRYFEEVFEIAEEGPAIM